MLSDTATGILAGGTIKAYVLISLGGSGMEIMLCHIRFRTNVMTVFYKRNMFYILFN